MARMKAVALALMIGCICPATGVATDEDVRTGSLTVLLSSAEYGIIPAGEEQRIEMEGFGFLMSPGKPLLPEKRFFVGLPPGAVVRSVEVEGIRPTELPGTYRIGPTSPSLPIADPEIRRELLRDMNREWQANYQAVYSSDA